MVVPYSVEEEEEESSQPSIVFNEEYEVPTSGSDGDDEYAPGTT